MYPYIHPENISRNPFQFSKKVIFKTIRLFIFSRNVFYNHGKQLEVTYCNITYSLVYTTEKIFNNAKKKLVQNQKSNCKNKGTPGSISETSPGAFFTFSKKPFFKNTILFVTLKNPSENHG